MAKPFKDGKHELETGFYSYAELTVKGAVDNTARGTLIMHQLKRIGVLRM